MASDTVSKSEVLSVQRRVSLLLLLRPGEALQGRRAQCGEELMHRKAQKQEGKEFSSTV